MTNTRRSTALLAVLAGFVLSQAAAIPASAADVPLVVYFEPESTTVEYGSFWTMPLKAESAFVTLIYQTDSYAIASTNAPAGYDPVLAAYETSDGVAGYLNASYTADPLPAGTYTFSLTGSYAGWPDTYTAEAQATLKIEKAKLGIELRVVPDPSNGDFAIVTARFTGKFVEEYQSTFYPTAPDSPEGTWHITITDDKGDIAVAQSVERSAGDDTLATSFYWDSAEPGVDYTATAEFLPSGSSANNFAIADASDFAYTGAEAQRPVPSSTAAAQPDASLPEPSAFGLPLWSLILGGVLLAGLTALVIVLSVRLARRSPSATTEVAA